ncbi:MAG: DUF488 domain-containing protein [Planctomycetota bacterium]
MSRSSEIMAERRASNAKALAAFGIEGESISVEVKTIAEGSGPSVFTIGYERRDGEDLISKLIDNGVTVLVDVRQRAMSRKADFRGKALAARCEEAGIDYVPMPTLGSTDELRDELRKSGDFQSFAKGFRALTRRKAMKGPIEELAELAEEATIAMICYERSHYECHRSVLAEVLHKKIDATIIAIQ